MLRAVLFEGKSPVSFSEEMKKSASYKLSAYPKQIIEAYYTRPGHYDVPFMGLLTKALGWVELLNPKGYVDFYKNKDYALENRLDKDGFERAYLHGDVYPKALLKQGKVLEAIQSFAKAIESGPQPEDSYFKLGCFLRGLIQYRDDLSAAQNNTVAFLRNGPISFEAGLEEIEFSNHTFLKHRSRHKDFSSSGSGSMTVPLPKDILSLNGKPADLQGIQTQLLALEIRLGEGGLEQMAQEAFEKSARFTKLPDKFDSGHRRQKATSQILAQFYAGNLDQAMTLVTNYLTGRFDPVFKPRDGARSEGLLLAARIADKMDLLDDSLALTETAMGQLRWEYDPIETQEENAFFLDFLKLCQRKANTLPTAGDTTFWQIALPGLKAMATNHMPVIREDGQPIPSRVFTVHKLLGDAHQALGNFPEAKASYEIALLSLDSNLESINDWIDSIPDVQDLRNQNAQKSFEEMSATRRDVEALLTLVSEPA
jgi:tetratricopeptide (TPR) repeat protein